LCTCASAVIAQTGPKDKITAPRQLLAERPRLFNNLPDKFPVKKLLLEQLFTVQDRNISVPVRAGVTLEGTILEKVQLNPNVISINIRLNNYGGSLLNISRITESDLSVNYEARVINIKNGDVLLLKKENDQFYFTRENISLIAVE
jgi:hypothetical protein